MKKYIVLFLVSLNIACGSSPKTTNSFLPEWVSEQPDLCGVGIQKVKTHIGTARKFSIGDARVDLSKKLETKVKSMVTSYAQSGEEDAEGFDENLSTAVSKNLSKTVLNGSVPSKFVIDAEYAYSLVCLKPDVLTDAINQMTQLNSAQRKALSRRAALMHKELDEQMKDY
jgi:hypothetical protein